MTTLAIAGFQGRIGQALCEALWNSDELTLGAITHHSPLSWDVEGLVPTTASALDDCFDVLIDFTSPASMIEHLDACLRLKKPVVIGTTGYSDEQKQAVIQASQAIPVFLASNMCVGVNVLMHLAAKASALLQDSDVEIFELHHAKKKDAPSGTALSIGEEVAQARKQVLSEQMITDRTGLGDSRHKGQIGFSVARGGNVAGDHLVMFLGQNERLSISHQAVSTDVFAKGALQVAQWLVKQPKGFYGMKDFLHLS